jgi:hypothetical protein
MDDVKNESWLGKRVEDYGFSACYGVVVKVLDNGNLRVHWDTGSTTTESPAILRRMKS